MVEGEEARAGVCSRLVQVSKWLHGAGTKEADWKRRRWWAQTSAPAATTSMAQDGGRNIDWDGWIEERDDTLGPHVCEIEKRCTTRGISGDTK